MTEVRLPIPCTSSMACWLHDPAVSCGIMEPEVELRWDSAKVSGTVTSQAVNFPLARGIKVAPSGRLPSLLRRPGGSLTAGICAPLTALRMS